MTERVLLEAVFTASVDVTPAPPADKEETS